VRPVNVVIQDTINTQGLLADFAAALIAEGYTFTVPPHRRRPQPGNTVTCGEYLDRGDGSYDLCLRWEGHPSLAEDGIGHSADPF